METMLLAGKTEVGALWWAQRQAQAASRYTPTGGVIDPSVLASLPEIDTNTQTSTTATLPSVRAVFYNPQERGIGNIEYQCIPGEDVINSSL